MWMLVAAAVVLALGGLAWRWARPPEVAAVQLRAAPLQQTLQFSARVATASRVELGATVTGRVQRVRVAEGQAVRAGEPLVELESDELNAALAQARAAEQQAAARLAGLRGTGRRGSNAALAQADSVLRAAQAEHQRAQALVAQGFVSAARLDDTQRALAVAQAQRDAAAAQRDAQAERGTDISQAQAQLALARAATQAAQARLAQAQLRAPADARVLVRTVEPGQIVQPGRALLTLALAGPLQLVAQVDERHLQQLAPGQAAQAEADAWPGRPFAATVQSIAPKVDAQRGAVEVKLSLPRVPDFLREDMTLSVSVRTAERARALALPLVALRGSGEPLVWRLADGRVQAQPVRLGLRTLDAAEVLQGLAEGDTVLIGPAPGPGARVRARLLPLAEVLATPATTAADSAAATLSNAMGR